MNKENSLLSIKNLIGRAKQGDREAFGVLYTTYFTPVFRYILIRMRSRQEAEDMTQTVFIKVWQSIYTYQEMGKPFLAWLFTIARNTIIDYSRKKKPLLVEDPIISQVDPSALYERKEWVAEILKYMENLSEDQRDAVTMRFFGECGYSEIACIMDKSEEAIRALVSRGLKHLRSESAHLTY